MNEDLDLPAIVTHVVAAIEDQRAENEVRDTERDEKKAWDKYALSWMALNADRFSRSAALVVNNFTPEAATLIVESIVGEIASYASALLTCRRRAFGEGVDMRDVVDQLNKKAEAEGPQKDFQKAEKTK